MLWVSSPDMEDLNVVLRFSSVSFYDTPSLSFFIKGGFISTSSFSIVVGGMLFDKSYLSSFVEDMFSYTSSLFILAEFQQFLILF